MGRAAANRLRTSGSRAWSGPALAIMLVSVAGAGGASPGITAIEIVPSRLVVGADASHATTFELEARLWTGQLTDRVSIVDSTAYVLQWTPSETWLKLVSASGFRATFEVPAGAGANRSAVVQVTAGGVTSNPGAEILVDPDGPDMDKVEAGYTPGLPPDAVVLNGDRSSPSDSCVSVSSFVARSAVGPLVAQCSREDPGWGMAVLSVNHAMVLTPGAWTSASDPPVDAGALQTPPLALPVALRVMVAPEPDQDLDSLRDTVLRTATADLARADSILLQSRAGIRLDTLPSATIAVSDKVEIASCANGDATTKVYDAPGALNVYYVNTLSIARGRSCDRHDDRAQDVIYVGWNMHSPTTLIHELGHALGLTLPGAGHTDTIRGLDRTNIMTAGDHDTDAGGRRRLTVGQAFRMNTDSASWLNWASNPPGDPSHPVRQTTLWPKCKCGSNDPANGCPGVGDDIGSRSERPDGIHDWVCNDQLLFLEAPEDEEPVAVIAGRRWRTAPGACRADLAGEKERHNRGNFVRFDNLIRPGKCDAWAAVFFRQHGVMFLFLTEPAVRFTQAADEVSVGDTMRHLVEVPVHVYYPSSEQNAVRAAEAHALATFGSSNRSGIRLQFDENENVTCPQTKPTAPDIEVCYLAAVSGGGEGKRSDRHIDVLGGHTESTVSHFIGQALGLLDLTAPGEADNVMYDDAAKRGAKLTLSQVLKINAGLNPALCGPPCPDLDPNVNP